MDVLTLAAMAATQAAAQLIAMALARLAKAAWARFREWRKLHKAKHR